METVQKPEGVHKIGTIRDINFHNICIKNRSRPPLCSVPRLTKVVMQLNHFTINILSLGRSLEWLIPPPRSRENKEAPEGPV